MNHPSPWLHHYDTGQVEEVPSGTVLTRFREIAESRPGYTLIDYFGASYTVRDIDRSADALAAGLAWMGVEAGGRIILMMQNMPQFVIAALASWKLGCVVVPVNPMYTVRELDNIVRDSEPAAVMCLDELYHSVVAGSVVADGRVPVITTSAPAMAVDKSLGGWRLPGHSVPAGRYDLLELIEKFSGAAPRFHIADPDSPAFLTYTSGTTGPSKGAMNSHLNCVFTSEVYRTWMRLSSAETILGLAPLFHITGLIGHITTSLLTPCRLVLGYRFEPEIYFDLVECSKPTFTIGAITAFNAWLNSPTVGERDLSSLVKVYSGGQAIPVAVVERFERVFGISIRSAYGLTETTSPSHFVPLSARTPVDQASGFLAVGVPVPLTEARVVGEDGAEVEPGSLGEIQIRGPGVVDGYWRRPAETRTAFDSGWLRSGDLGYMSEDGWFFVVDRLKDVINASGYKVWPGEVEQVLVSEPRVREAAVIGVPDRDRGEVVVAFVSLAADAEVTAAGLAGYARERLAAYKCPRRIEIVDEIPKNAAGKILRRELRARSSSS